MESLHPLQVVYQNDKEKLTQLLTVDVLIGRKISGDLGIMQMIAAPRTKNTPNINPTTTNPESVPTSTKPAEPPNQ